MEPPPVHTSIPHWLSRIRWTLSALVLFAWAAALQSTARATEEDLSARPTLRAVADFWTIPASEKHLPHAIDYDIWVTYVDPQFGNLWFSLDGYPGYLPVNRTKTAPPLPPNRRVRLQGSIIPHEGLTAERVRVTLLDQSNPPQPLSISGQVDRTWHFDQKLVSAHAYVDKQLHVDDNHLRLHLVVENRPVIGWVWLPGTRSVPSYERQYVTIVGVYSARSDPSGTSSDIEIWASGTQNLTVTHPISSEEAFDREITPIRNIVKTTPGTEVVIRGRVQGQVTGSHIVVRDDTGQVTAHTVQEERLAIGTEVDVVGRTSPFGTAWTVNRALFRVRSAPDTAPPGDRQAPLVWAEEVRQLSGEDAAAGRRVLLTGVITWSLPEQEYLFFSDVSGGVRVRLAPDQRQGHTIGASATIEGETYQTPLGPAVKLKHINILVSMRLPAPKAVSYEQAITGSEDAQWVEMRGYLRDHEVRGGRTHLNLTTPAGNFTACIQTPEDLRNLDNALIRIRGVCDTAHDPQGRVSGFNIWLPYLHSISVDEDAPADPFDVPQHSIPHLRQLSASHSIRRVRVAGTVVHHVPGDHLYLQHGSDGLLVLSRDGPALQPGDQVEAVGLLGRDWRRTVLRAATYRKTGSEPAPGPIRIEEELSLGEAHDGRLAVARGTLVNTFSQPDGLRLTLQQGKTLFEANLSGVAAAESAGRYPLGAGLEITGIYRAQVHAWRDVHGFELEVRSADDIRVFQKPRLLTAQRAIAAVGILGGLSVLGFVWATVLRRQVRRQMHQIRSQLEREVQLEDRHRSIVENASDFIFTTDLSGRITSFNPAGERLTGFTQAEALTMSLREIVVPDATGHFLLDPGNLPMEGTVTFQGQLRTRDGRTIWTETSSRLVTEGGRATGLLGVVRDISERKQIEEEMKRARDAAEANTRAKSEFLANMSHEIRTPMNAVIGMSNLLLDTPLDERQRDFAETIRSGAEALLTVLNDILDFSKIEAGRLQVESVEFDLREVIENAVGLLAPRAADKGLEMALLLPPDLPCAVRGDPGRLRQVVLNLLGNAVKFTEQGEVLLSVALEPRGETAVYRFEFQDTGVGLTEEQQARLFRPFAQADTSTTRRFGGTGLGLAISKQIVELMGGACGVRSRVGHGSTFWFTARLPAGSGRTSTPPLEVPSLPPARILVIDDSEVSRRVFQTYLTHCGLLCETEVSARAGLERIQQALTSGSPFAAVVVDDTLPDTSSLETIRTLRANPALASVRLLACTSPNRVFHPAEMEKLSVDDVLGKPLRYADLLGAVRKLFSQPPDGSIEPFSGRKGLSAPPMSAPLAPGPDGPERLRVLVAEDNLVNQRVVMLQLQKLGHRATAVNNGAEAIQALEGDHFDVILMDCQMPVMDGIEATRVIRSRPEYADTRIIALTADVMHGARERCAAAGMDDYLSKPIRVGELQTALAKFVRKT